MKKNEYYIISLIVPILRISVIDNEGYFDFEKGRVKNCLNCVLNRQKVIHKDNNRITGLMGNYGISGTPYVYVFWDRIPPKMGIPSAFENINNLILEKPLNLKQ